MDSIILYVFCLVVSSITNAKELYEWKVFMEAWNQSHGPNFVVSPFSLYPVLGSLAWASDSRPGRTQTRDEILYAMDADNINEASSNYANVVRDMESLRGVDIGIANKIYLAPHVKLDPEYYNASVNLFHVQLENIDFNNAVQAANDINYWVQIASDNQIKNFVSPQTLPGNQILLVNTIYFDGKWKYPFTGSFVDDFHIDQNTISKVYYTSVTTHLHYVYDEERSLKAVLIPYQGDECSLMVILRERFDLYNFFKYDVLGGEPYFKEDLKNHLRYKYMTLNIPLFEIVSQVNLRKLLINMNIMKIFSHDAELSAIISNATVPLHLTNGYQRASIRITDDGKQSGPVNQIKPGLSLTVNRPFYYEINCNGGLIFNGVVSQL